MFRYFYKSIFIYIHTCTCRCRQKRIHAHICIHIYIYTVYTCAYTVYIHVFLHLCIHMYIRDPLVSRPSPNSSQARSQRRHSAETLGGQAVRMRVFHVTSYIQKITLLRVIPTMTFIHFPTGKSSGILSDISSDILFGILSGISSGI